MVVVPPPDIVAPLPVRLRALVTVRFPLPVNVELPISARVPLTTDALAIERVLLLMVRFSSEVRLLIVCTPPRMIVGLAATETVTSSAEPGSNGLLVQLAGSVQFTPSPPPVHDTAARSVRDSSCSTA